MSVETKEKREHGAGSEVELWITLCKGVARLIHSVPEDDQADLLELLQVMGRSEEEMEDGGETLRELLRPYVGVTVPMLLPARRPASVQKWADYVGGRIKELRKNAKLTQEDLAEKAKLPQPHISRIESGEISPTRLTLDKIAGALGVSIEELDPSL